jgi:hypothetical protein
LTLSPFMQQTIFGDEPRRTELDQRQHCPAVKVQSIIPFTCKSGVEVLLPKTDYYLATHGEGIFITWDNDSATVRCENPFNSKGISKTQAHSGHTHSLHPEISFYPQGSLGSYVPIKDDCCVYTLGDKSCIFGQDASIQGPFPCNPPLSMLTPLPHRRADQSEASQVSVPPRHGAQYLDPGNTIGDYFPNVPLPDHQFFHDDATNVELAYGQFNNNQSVFGDSIDNQTGYDYPANGEPTYGLPIDSHSSVFGNIANDQRTNGLSASHYCPFEHIPLGGTGEAEPGGAFNEAFDTQLPQQSSEPFDWPGGYM